MGMEQEGYDTLVSASCFHIACSAYIISCGLKLHAAGKKKIRGEGRLTIKIGLNLLDSQQTSLVFSPHMCQECQTSRLW